MTELRRKLPGRIVEYCDRAVPTPPESPLGTVLEQVGEMRLAPEKDWMPFTAEQTLSATSTAFVWHARFKMAPLVTAVVEDAYEGGHGRLDAKIWGIVPVAHARGLEVDQGEAQRYLAELSWCPLAFLHNPELSFSHETEYSIRVSVHDDATWVDLRFDDSGDIIAARTDARPRGETPQPWAGRFEGHRDFGGIRAPSRGEVWWETPEGRYVYWRGEITRLEFAPD